MISGLLSTSFKTVKFKKFKICWLKLFTFVFFVVNGLVSIGQNNYWSNQYSASATLQGGAAMNSNDNSIFYYNPGAVGFLDTSTFNVGATVYGFDHVLLKNGAGKNLNLESNNVNITPQIMALNIAFKEYPRFRFAFGYILKNSNKFSFQQENNIQTDVIAQAPGLEYYRSKFDFGFSSAEYWGGMAIGYKVNDHISLGLGNYGSYFHIDNLLFQENSADAINPSGTPYTANVLQRLKYNLDHVSVILKPGIDIRYGNFKIGLAATMPSIKLWSQGRVYQSFEISNLHYYTNAAYPYLTQYPSLVVQGEQKNIKPQWKQAPSIALGLEYNRDTYKWSINLEYFFKLEEYDLIRGEDNVYLRPAQAFPQNPVVDFMRVKTASYAVLNAGIGLDKKISEKTSLLTGFNTDFNNKVPLFESNYKDYVVSVNPGFWHFIHYSLGLCLTKGPSKTYLGLTYKYGFSPYHKSFASFSDPSDQHLLSGPQGMDMQVSAHGVGFVLGFTNFMFKELPIKIKLPKI